MLIKDCLKLFVHFQKRCAFWIIIFYFECFSVNIRRTPLSKKISIWQYFYVHQHGERIQKFRLQNSLNKHNYRNLQKYALKILLLISAAGKIQILKSMKSITGYIFVMLSLIYKSWTVKTCMKKRVNNKDSTRLIEWFRLRNSKLQKYLLQIWQLKFFDVDAFAFLFLSKNQPFEKAAIKNMAKRSERTPSAASLLICMAFGGK